MVFGFAQPIQRRLPMAGGPQSQPLPMPDPSSYGGLSSGQVTSGLQRMGLGGSPAPISPSMPNITSPAMPAGSPIDDASGAINGAVSNITGAPAAASAAAPAASSVVDALGSGGGGSFMSWLASLFA